MKIKSLNLAFATYPILEDEFELDSSVWNNQFTTSSNIIDSLIKYGYFEFYHGNLMLTSNYNPYLGLDLSQDYDEYDRKIINDILSIHYYQQNLTIDLEDFLSLNNAPQLNKN